MAYTLNSVNIETSYGIIAGRAPGSNVSVEGCFDFPKRTGDIYYSWPENNSVQPYTDSDEIFFEGRDILFYGYILGTVSHINAHLTAFYTAIEAFTGLVSFVTPYGTFSVQVKSVIPAIYKNTVASVVITFREPVVTLTGGSLPAEASNNYMIDGIPMSSFGLYYSKGNGQHELPGLKDQHFTKYGSEGYQITKYKEKTFEFEGFITGTSFADFQSKLLNLYFLFKSAGLRDFYLNGQHVTCFAKDGFKISNLLIESIVPSNALLNDDGLPILNDDGSYILTS